MDEATHLRMRRGHTKHRDYCTCGRSVCGNGGRHAHREMHRRKKDGHISVIKEVWDLMFPGHDGRKSCVPTLERGTAIYKVEKERQRLHPPTSASTG